MHAVLADWRMGACALPDAFQAILDGASELALAAVVAAIPLELREAFVAWLRATYGNDAPVEAFVWVGPPRDPAAGAQSIARARRWLAELDAVTFTPAG